MKKFLSTILAAILIFTVTACSGRSDNNTGTTTEPGTSQTTAPETTTTPETTASESKDIIPSVDADTFGGMIWDAFYADITANPDASAEELAANIVDSGIIPFSLGGMALNNLAVPDAEGKLYLQGFDNYDFAGLDTEKSAVFLPMIGSIPFIGYIFELSDGVDAADFIKALEENANLRWQICVSADQMVAGSVGSKVFFLMCPESVEE